MDLNIWGKPSVYTKGGAGGPEAGAASKPGPKDWRANSVFKQLKVPQSKITTL